jgi:CubicO group peptidase (beta-lactamase class C family)
MSRRRARRAAALALVATLTACGSPAPRTDSPTADSPPQLVPAMPLPENAVANAIGKLDGIAEELMNSSGIPGMAIAVVHGGKTVYAKGFGVRDVRVGEKVDPGTVFQLASVSKPLAATVVAHQVGAGVIGWETAIVDELPWFALSDPAVTRMLTVGDLFAHRSGLPDHAGDVLEDLGYDRRAVLERLRLLPLDPFRASYAYTNFGVTAAAEAVATASGRSWEDLSTEVLYRPLGMKTASSRFSDFESQPNKAIGHVKADGRYAPRFTRDPDAQSPAGGVSASVTDLTHWLMMMLADGSYNGAPVVDAAALLPALTPQMVSSPPAEPAMRSGFYGYGFNIGTSPAGRVHFSHSGAFDMGAATNFVIIPAADVAIVALTNATPSGIPETLTAEFADLVEFGEVREDWRGIYAGAFAGMNTPIGDLAGKQPPADPSPARAASSYIGTYVNDYWGPVTVTDDTGALTLSLGPKPIRYPMTHWDGDVFTIDLTTENAPPGSVSKVNFAGNMLTIEVLDDALMGTFTR